MKDTFCFFDGLAAHWSLFTPGVTGTEAASAVEADAAVEPLPLDDVLLLAPPPDRWVPAIFLRILPIFEAEVTNLLRTEEK